MEAYKMWKKFSAIFVLAIFLLSMIPMAFAEEGTAEEGTRLRLQQRVHAEEGETIEGPANATPMLLRARTQEQLETAKEHIASARERYQLAKEHYLSVKEAYMAKKAVFLEAKEKYRNCRGVDSEECDVKRSDVKSKAQPYLLKVADLVLKELEKVKAKVEASEDLSEEEIAEIVADLDEKIQEVEDAKSVIENIDEDSTREEINDAAKTIREAWSHTKVSLKRHAGRMVNARLGNIVHRTEMLETKLEKTRDRLEAKGLDVSELDNMIDEFNSLIDTAKEKYKELTEAKEALQEAKELLREIVQEIKDLNKGSLEVEADESEEEEEAAEEE
jgi:chromosome segregation ATPase